MITSDKVLDPLPHVVFGAGVDLSKLTPAQLYALGARLAARADAPAARMKKTKGGQKPRAKPKPKPKPEPKPPVSIPRQSHIIFYPA